MRLDGATRLLMLLGWVWIDELCEALSLSIHHHGQSHVRHAHRFHETAAKRIGGSSLCLSSGSSGDDCIDVDFVKAVAGDQKKTLYRVEKFARLPVWPAWNGALIWLTGRLFGNTFASQLEDKITGRVCPNIYENTTETSPFLLLVHHCHSFAIGDVGRYFQKTVILPEGFPSHPHRGFNTLTYFLDGGFRHRDSTGVEQFYGVKARHHEGESYPHSQWLKTGAGVLHEEMFDLTPPRSQDGVDQNPSSTEKYSWTSREFWWQRHELYQLWVNVPANEKMDQPSVVLLSDANDTPVIREGDGSVKVRVLAGNYRQQHKATTPITTDMLVLHVELRPGQRWTCPFPDDFETCFLYLRKGSVVCLDGQETEIPPHHTAFFTATGNVLELQASSTSVADFMLLAGVPIREPCVTRGSMVMTNQQEIQQAYADYQDGLFGQPWDHNLSREEWQEHVRRYPSRFR